MALAKIGSNRLNNLETDATPQAIYCRTHYEQTRDALIRSHYWRFASARAELSADVDTPAFEWDYQFSLPNDFLALKSIYEDNNSPDSKTIYSFAIEGKKILTNESTCQIRYVKKVTDVTEFDPLFVEVLVLQLALKLVGALSGGDAKLQDIIQRELAAMTRKVRALDRQETSTIGRANIGTWIDARLTEGARLDY